jgi:hypothetical protein
MDFNPKGIATGIGSFPQTDSRVVSELILKTLPEIPFWPQLPNTDFHEQMEIQYTEGFPCVVFDDIKKRMHFEIGEDPTEKLSEFYENVVSDNLDYFKISPAYSRGIYEMEQMLKGSEIPVIQFFKHQVTGPLTFGLGRTDENKRAIYYNEIFRDVIIKGLIMKARWMLNKFKPFGLNQICFVDEPILSAFGSSVFVSVSRQEVVASLQEVYSAIHTEGALAGTHCCGNTEWTILIDAGVDIISLDAYEYADTIAFYYDPIKSFLERGGVLAWGIVPSSEKINMETPESLVKRLELSVEKLANKGIDINLIRNKCLLTPSCGTGSISVELSNKVFSYLKDISHIVREQWK